MYRGVPWCGFARAVFVTLTLATLLAGLGACASSSAALTAATPTASSSALGLPTSLPLGCPGGGSPYTDATRMTLQPDHGPVGAMVNVIITGGQAGCHTTLNIAVPPALSETHNTPDTTPGLSYPVQWITLGADGSLTLPYCVCATMLTWANDAPQITSVTPQPGTAGVGDYAPKAGDYFFFTLGGSGAPVSAPVFARFTVTG
ncbi:MAG TPA: hypothetical protein VFU60_09760 [Ktedonobacterales bacterium]|nr:hypothetical protein [Ktedonobacterales bacterium]